MQQRVRKSHRGKILRPPDNSPFRRHLTRDFLLCSQVIIQQMTEKVNRKYQILEDVRKISDWESI